MRTFLWPLQFFFLAFGVNLEIFSILSCRDLSTSFVKTKRAYASDQF